MVSMGRKISWPARRGECANATCRSLTPDAHPSLESLLGLPLLIKYQ